MQCTERFCIYLKVCGPVLSLNTDSIYLSILHTSFFFLIEICYILKLKHHLGFLFFFFPLHLKSPVRKLPFAFGRKIGGGFFYYIFKIKF